jgi:hypothetical protein
MSVYSTAHKPSESPEPLPLEPLPMGGPVLWLIVELKRRRQRARAAARSAA